MKNERNPIPIDSKKKKTGTKPAAKGTTAQREHGPKSPARPKKAAQSKGAAPAKRAAAKHATRHKTTERNHKTTERNKGPAKSAKAKRETKSDSMPVRLPENRHPDLHQRSYAAHLDGGSMEPHTKPMTTMRAGAFPMARKQP
ncbi:MAG TPA: hypothetical protein VGJ21_03400 [Terracidiphilus sp.]|jgi:hypothetical protein